MKKKLSKLAGNGEDHFETKLVGEIPVDSGQICVMDPCHCGDDPYANGVVVPTNHGDGMYPVEEIWIDGEREGLFISLQGPYAELFKTIRKTKHSKEEAKQ